MNPAANSQMNINNKTNLDEISQSNSNSHPNNKTNKSLVEPNNLRFHITITKDLKLRPGPPKTDNNINEDCVQLKNEITKMLAWKEQNKSLRNCNGLKYKFQPSKIVKLVYKKENETEEERQIRLSLKAKYQRTLREAELPETRALRLAKRNRVEQIRKETIRRTETAEERRKRLERQREYSKAYRLRLKLKQNANSVERLSTVSKHRNESYDLQRPVPTEKSIIDVGSSMSN